MKTFAYRGFDFAGRPAKGLVEALDLKDAREKLSARGVLAERLDAAAGGATAVGPRRTPAFNFEARAVLYRELNALLLAGIPLAGALDILIQSPAHEAHATLLAAVRDRVREGSGLAGALAATHPQVSPFELAVLTVGERAGTLDGVLEQLAGFLDEQQDLKEHLQSALIYPSFVLALAVVIAAGIIGFLIPNIAKLFQEQQAQLPLLTRGLIAAGKYGAAVLPPLLAAVVAGAWWWRRRLRADAGARRRLDRRLFSLPLTGRAYQLLVNLRFAQTMSLLLRGGVQLVDGIELAGAATGSPWVAELLKAETEAVRHGRSLSEALRNVPPLNTSLPGWISAGEASGKLEPMFDQAAGRFRQQWNRLVRRLLALLEPVLVLAVGLFVFIVALGILLPILSMNDYLR